MDPSSELPTASPSRWKPYRGWRVVGALALAEFALFGVAFFAFIIFTSSLAQEFGWSGAQTGSLVSALWVAAPLTLFCGPLIERIGPWRLVIGGLCLEAACFVALSFINQYGELYLLRVLMGVGKVLIVSSLPIIVARWFSRRFATATAIVWAGSPAGGLLVAPATEMLTAEVGWRTAAWICALGLLAVTALVGLLGRGAPPARHDNAAHDDEMELPSDSVVVHEGVGGGGLAWRAMSRSVNWVAISVMVACTAGFGMANIAVFSQHPKLLQLSGLSPSLAALMLGLTSGAAMVGSASIGMVLDRFRVAWGGAMVGFAVAVGAGCFMLLQQEDSFLLALVGSLCLGYAAGAFDILWITITRRTFGIKMFPRTYTVWYFALQVGCAAGGGVGGWALDHLGSWGFLLLVSALYLPAVVFSILPLAGVGTARAK